MILNELEIYFPPAFFDVMVYLLIHVVDDIIQLGPMFLHGMMPFERMNGVQMEASSRAISPKSASLSARIF